MLSKTTWACAKPIRRSTATATTAAYAFIIFVPPRLTSDYAQPPAASGRRRSSGLGESGEPRRSAGLEADEKVPCRAGLLRGIPPCDGDVPRLD